MGTGPGPEGRLQTRLGPDPPRPRASPAPPHRGHPAGRAVHTPARRSRPLGDPRRAAPPRGRCSAAAGREPAGGVPFKSRERRATAPPPSPPESSPHRAEPGSRCARRCASHSLPGIGSPGHRLPSRRRSPDTLGASGARVSGSFEVPTLLGLELLTVRAWRCGLGCPGEAVAADRREEPGGRSTAAPGMRGHSSRGPSVRGARTEE